MPLTTAHEIKGYDTVAVMEHAEFGVIMVTNNNSNFFHVHRSLDHHDEAEPKIWAHVDGFEYGEFDATEAYRKAVAKMVEIAFAGIDTTDAPST